jgi:hypothetical protein
MANNYFNPSACNNVLADVAAAASTTSEIIAPYALFYSSADCGGGGGVTGASFPQYYLPVVCPPDVVIPPASDNCLRVISSQDFAEGSKLINPHFINYLPSQTLTTGNIFESPDARLFSWYIPLNYTFIFYKENPSSNVPNQIPQLVQSSNFVQIDSCLGLPTLSDGSSFWTSPPTGCQPAEAKLFTHAAPYLVVIENETYQSMIVDMCTSNRQLSVGTSSLNTVWFPGSSGCDQQMKSLCSLSGVESTEFAEVCSCFTQQAALDRQFPNLNVGVCSFGSSTLGDINKSCAFNDLAYKTKSMAVACASFAQCNSFVINPNTKLATNVTCQGQFVDFPIAPTVTTSVIPAVTTESTSVSALTWIFLAIAVIFLLCFLINLAFI